MTPVHRLPVEGFSQSVDWIRQFFGVDNRTATLLLWEVAFHMGTDRHYWIDEVRAQKFIDNGCELALGSARS